MALRRAAASPRSARQEAPLVPDRQLHLVALGGDHHLLASPRLVAIGFSQTITLA